MDQVIKIGAWIAPFIILISVFANYISSNGPEEYLRKYVFSLIVFVPIIITWGDVEFCFWLSSAHLLSSVLAIYEADDDTSPKTLDYQTGPIEDKGFKLKNIFSRLRLRPAQAVLISFIALISLGTFLLMLPVSTLEGKDLSFIDAIFMATSATCVTGLSTLSLKTDFSLFGQIVILILIQIGGLGIMTLSSSMTILLGKSMGMKDRIVMQDLLDVSSLEDLFAVIVDIIRYTFLIELWGAVVLTLAFTIEGFDFTKAIYYGLFHSVSAFCNAGFSLFDHSLESYSVNPLIHGTIAVLVILGGLGFIVLKEAREVLRFGRSFVRITLHTKIVLITTVILIFLGAIFIFFWRIFECTKWLRPVG